MAITLRQLEIFCAVAETEQVTRASDKMFLTQSAVSMALSELQNQLDGPLFDRHGRSLLMNDRGRYLLPLAKDILCQVNNIESLMAKQSDSVVGTLQVVASSTIGNYVLPYLVGIFKRMHPAATVNMLVTNTRRAEQLIIDGGMDLGFVEGEVVNDQVTVQSWLEDELVVIASPNHEIARKELFRVPDDLAQCQWIMREKGSGTAQIFKKKLGVHVTRLQVAMEMGHTEAIKKAVEAGAGVGCLSNLTVCREVDQGCLVKLRVDGIDMQRMLHIIHYRKKLMTPLMQEFVEFCRIIRECSQGSAWCLTAPWKLQEMLVEKK